MPGRRARSRLGRAVERRLAGLGARWTALLLVAGFTLVRLPFRSRFLVNWDAVNFALGMQAFDLGHHQPHAPGYIGYVAAGRALSWITGDANAALTLISVVAGAVLPAVFYLLARRILSRRFALAAAVVLGTSPVVWYYSSVALTYIVGAAVAVGIAWAAHVARIDRSRWHLYAGAALLALLGALRQTDLLLLLPVLGYAAWAFPWRQRLRAAGLAAGLSALWLVPLLVSTGGVSRYLDLSRRLASHAGGQTWALGGNLAGIAQNVGLVGLGLLLGMGAALLVVPLAVRYRPGGRERIGGETRRLLAVWVLPSAAVFLLIHTGQLGYVLLILPAFVLWAAAAAEGATRRAAPGAPDGWVGRLLTRLRTSVRGPEVAPTRLALPAGVVLLATVNVASFVFVPDAAVRLLTRDRAASMAPAMVPEDGGVVTRTRQYVLPENDSYWRQLVDWVRTFPRDRTVVLAVPLNGASFRHLSYYTPWYRVYGVGEDRQGTFGYLFSAYRRHSGYSVAALEGAQTTVALPATTEWLIVPDRADQARLPSTDVDRRLEVDRGPDAIAVRVPPGSMLRFRADEPAVVRTGGPAPGPDDGAVEGYVEIVPATDMARGETRRPGPSPR